MPNLVSKGTPVWHCAFRRSEWLSRWLLGLLLPALLRVASRMSFKNCESKPARNRCKDAMSLCIVQALRPAHSQLCCYSFGALDAACDSEAQAAGISPKLSLLMEALALCARCALALLYVVRQRSTCRTLRDQEGLAITRSSGREDLDGQTPLGCSTTQRGAVRVVRGDSCCKQLAKPIRDMTLPTCPGAARGRLPLHSAEFHESVVLSSPGDHQQNAEKTTVLNADDKSTQAQSKSKSSSAASEHHH